MNKKIVLSSLLVLSTMCSAADYNEIVEDRQIIGSTIVDLNVNSEDLNVGIKYDLSNVNKSFKPNMSYLGIRYLKIDEEENNKNGLVEINFSIKDFIKTIPGFKVGIGAKMVYTNYDFNNGQNADFLAIPIGIEAEYFLPAFISPNIPISIEGSAYYAPNPLSLMDANDYFETIAKINFRLLEHTNAYVGYRSINTNYDNDIDVLYNENWFVGVSFGF